MVLTGKIDVSRLFLTVFSEPQYSIENSYLIHPKFSEFPYNLFLFCPVYLD